MAQVGPEGLGEIPAPLHFLRGISDDPWSPGRVTVVPGIEEARIAAVLGDRG